MNKPAPALALSEGQRQTLQRLSRSTSAANRLVVRSRALLLAGDGVANARIAAECGVEVSSTGFDGDHQAWRNIDGGTEEVPGGTAGAVDPDDVGRPSGPGVASQRVPADR